MKPSAKRVCRVLEGMYLLDMHEKIVGKKKKRIVSDPKFAAKVYMFCHIASGNGCPHKDWEEVFLEVEKEVLSAMRSPAEKAKDDDKTRQPTGP